MIQSDSRLVQGARGPARHRLGMPRPRLAGCVTLAGWRSFWLTLAVVFGLAQVAHAQGPSPASMVSLDEARMAFEAGRATLIDIREPAEHATGVAAGAKLLPMSQLAQRIGEVPADPAKPVLLICNTQNRSSAVLRALRERGYPHVRYVHGGMSEWARRGWPMVKPAASSSPTSEPRQAGR
jgi:rhodanese-related sulfurtransferase